MLSAILACALAPFLQSNATDGPGVRVLARDDGGFGVAAIVTPERPWAVPIPLTSRSEVVQRVVPGPDGLALRFEGLDDRSAVKVEAVAHPIDQQVLIVDGKPVLVGPPTLPRRVETKKRDQIPLLARQDEVFADGDGLEIVPPAGQSDELRLVLIGRMLAPSATLVTTMDQQSLAMWDAQVDARAAIALKGVGTWNLRTLGGPASEPRTGIVQPGFAFDQVFYATVAPIEPTSIEALDVRAVSATDGGLELRLAVPEGRAGTWTVLVTVELPHEPLPRAEPVPADADRPGTLRERSADLGLHWSHLEGPDEQLDIRPTMGPGAAWGDVDGDGWNDLYLVQGGGRACSEVSANRLMHNEGGRGFSDATATIGGGDRGAGMGALFLDGDGDGDLDLYVANYGADVLFENRPSDAHLQLVDVSAAAGVPGDGNDDKWSAGVAASDYDRDGDLDLYVTSYLVYDPALMPPVGELAYSREDPIEMLPFAFPGQANTFLKNESGASGMRFVDVTDELGLADVQGRGMQPIFLDFDRDGDDDLYVANDVSYNVLFRNEGDGTFKDVSFPAGLDDPRGGMGLATGDVDLDGDEDVFLTNWELDANALYLNNLLSNRSRKHHVATFRDGIVASGLGPAGIGRTSWGCELFDLENDGDLDLFVANGYTSPDYESTGICVGQPNQLFLNDGTGKFVDASAKAGPDVTRKLPSRAAVACDFDQDGDVDLVVTANNGPVQLLRNELPPAAKGRWLLVRLRGAGGNTHGIGAEVTVTAGGRTWRRELRAGTSYLGGNPPELHFGLGAADAVERIEVRWPSGAVTTQTPDGVDRVVVLRE